MENLERHHDSIDRLTSLVSKINVKWIGKTPHTSLKFIKTDTDAKVGVDNSIFNLKTNPLVETRVEMKGNITTITGIIVPTMEIGLEIIIDGITEDLPIGLMTGMVITDLIIGVEVTTDKTLEVDKTIEVMTLDRDMEIGVKVEIGPETIVMTETEVETEAETEIGRHRTGPELCQMTEEDQL